MTDCSTLELISPDLWISMDGYVHVYVGVYLLSIDQRCFSFEFASNEIVNATSVVSLETSSTDTGSKDFIAVGTSINRGEDLATKGCVRHDVHRCFRFTEMCCRLISLRLSK